MKQFGLTIKNIRKAKGMLQKEVYQNITGRTFTYQFEKGEHDISAEKLVMILKNLNISFDEFLLIHHNYVYEPYSELYQAIFSALKINNLAALEEIYQSNFKTNDNNRKVIAAYSHALFLINTRRSLNDDVVVFLKNYLIQQTHWTLTDIELFQYAMVIFIDQLDYLKLITASVMADLKKYFDSGMMPEKIELIISEILINYIQLLILKKNLLEAQQFSQSVAENFSGIKSLEAILNIKCANLLIDFFDDSKHQESSETYFDIVNFLVKNFRDDNNLKSAGLAYKRLAEERKK